MAFFPSAEKKRVYRLFKDLDATEYHAIVHFYEENLEIISHLEYEQYLELLYAYNNALFETGNNKKHYEIAEELIREAILNNIRSYQGEADLLSKVLFQKAASAYQLGHYEESCELLRQLIRINPFEPIHETFLARCIRASRKRFKQSYRAITILSLMLSAALIALEILLVRPVFPQHVKWLEWSRNFFFVLGVLTMIGGEVWLRLSSLQEAKAYVEEAKRRKQE